MKWGIRAGGVLAAGAVGLAGCASVPPLDNPALVRPRAAGGGDIQAVAAGEPTPEGYFDVYDRALDALDDYFQIKVSSRHSGTIETFPRVAPGYEQPWKPGSPSARERLLATFQTIRHYAVVHIAAGERGGFRVYVEVYKELEVTSQPALAYSVTPVFRDSATVDRGAEVIAGPTTSERQWIPAGPAPHRDYAFEQAILQKIMRPSSLK